MKRRLHSLQRLLELARHDAQRRARPVTSADAGEVRHIAQRALAALPGRAGFKAATRAMGDARRQASGADAVLGSADFQSAVSRVSNPQKRRRWQWFEWVRRRGRLEAGSGEWQPAVARIGDPRGSATWADVFERLCWRAAGATAAVCLALLLLHRPAPEPDVSVLLLDWPAETGDLF